MRLIDADKLPKYTGYALSADEVAMAVLNAPTVDIDAITESHEKIGYDKGFRDGYAQATVDAVEVVRCKDCKWWKTKYMRLGERKVCVIEAYEPVRNEDEYCSWAERREDD